MLAILTFQHRHPQTRNAAPARLQAAPIMPIPRELLGISAFDVSMADLVEFSIAVAVAVQTKIETKE